jgi:hypothetical protein
MPSIGTIAKFTAIPVAVTASAYGLSRVMSPTSPGDDYPTVPGDYPSGGYRPSPPNVADITQVVSQDMWSSPSADQRDVVNAALRGGRSASETHTIVKGAADALWSWTSANKRDVIVAALGSPYDAQGISDAIKGVQNAMWSHPQDETKNELVSMLSGRGGWGNVGGSGRPNPPDSAGLMQVVSDKMWSYNSQDQATVRTAAMRGGRSVDEAKTIIGGVQDALWSWPHTDAVDVMSAALMSPYDARGVADTVKSLHDSQWSPTVADQKATIISALGGGYGGYPDPSYPDPSYPDPSYPIN